MTVVVDVGAARYGDDYSMERLIKQFEPTWLYGIDPHPLLKAPDAQTVADLLDETNFPGECKVDLIPAAAWTYNGQIGFLADGLRSWVAEDDRAPQVPCIDLSEFLKDRYVIHEDEMLVLKLDCEGAEYELLPHLIEQQVDELLDVVIVEWHPLTLPNYNLSENRKWIESEIRCKIREWPW